MDYLKYLIYGLIQGITEFVPISSTAHLKILSLFFGLEDPGSSLSAIIQLGSVFAIFVYFKNEIFEFFQTNKRKSYKHFISNKFTNSIFIGTIPILFIGGFVKFFVPNFSNSFFRSNLLIALLSIIMSLFMFIADQSNANKFNLKNHSYFSSFIIGISQAFAIFPGVSRSGITISTALLIGWQRNDAAKYSFLLGIPSITLAAILELYYSFGDFKIISPFPLILGLLTAFLSSLISIHFLIRYINLRGLKLFIYYRLFFGIAIILNLFVSN